jgi:hypothetical protein
MSIVSVTLRTGRLSVPLEGELSVLSAQRTFGASRASRRLWHRPLLAGLEVASDAPRIDRGAHPVRQVGDPAPQSPPGAAYTRRPHQEGPWPHPARYDLRWEPTQ